MTATKTRKRASVKQATLRAAIYVRVSKDKSGEARSPKEQEHAAREECARRGWSIVDVYCDNDIGASPYARERKGKRPEWERMLLDIDARNVDIVVTWATSRLTRDSIVMGDLIRRCRDAGVLLSVQGSVSDFSKSADKFMARVNAAIDEKYVDDLRDATMRALAANAVAGKPHGAIPFGYARQYDERTGRLVGQIIDEENAALVRDWARRILNGETLHSIARSMEYHAGPDPATPRKFTPQAVRRILLNPAHLGHRSWHGEIVCENAWPALLDESTYYAVRERIMANGAPYVAGNAARRPGSVRHLLGGGLITCDKCDEPVYGFSNNTAAVYKCRLRHYARRIDKFDAVVERFICAWLSDPARRRALTGQRKSARAGNEAALKALQAQLAEAEQEMADLNMSAAAFGRLEARLAPKIEELTARVRAERVEREVSPLAELLTVDDVAARWDALTFDDKRRVLRVLLVDARLTENGGRWGGRAGLTFKMHGGDEVAL